MRGVVSDREVGQVLNGDSDGVGSPEARIRGEFTSVPSSGVAGRGVSTSVYCPVGRLVKAVVAVGVGGRGRVRRAR